MYGLILKGKFCKIWQVRFLKTSSSIAQVLWKMHLTNKVEQFLNHCFNSNDWLKSNDGRPSKDTK